MLHYLFGAESSQPLDPTRLREILQLAQENRGKLRNYPLSKIIRALHEAGKKWADPNYPGRLEALEKLPGLIGFSRPMVEQGLDYLAASLDRDALLADLTLQLDRPEYLDRFVVDQKYDGLLRAEPHGVLLHVSAGNVFVGAALHVVQGLLTKNVNLIKLSSADPLFPILVARSVVEADPFLKHGLALMHWKGGDETIEGLLKQSVNAISVFGGEEAVESYRRGLAPQVELFRHGPKVGVALIGKEAAWNQELADRLVHDAVMWDQNACSSPQLVYLEGAESRVKAFIPLLAEAFRRRARDLPLGELSDDEKVEITKVREMAKVEKFHGIAEATYDRGNIAWTILYKSDPGFETSPLNRTLLVKRVDDLAQIEGILHPYLFYLQSVGLELPLGRLEPFADRLSFLGLTRLTAIGRMSAGKNGSPHDGGYPLQELIRWASLEREFVGYTDLDYLAPEHRRKILAAKLEDLVHTVRERSPFYREYWGDKTRFEDLPVLDRKTLAPHLPPDNTEALTGPLAGTYVFSSGGTMGKPRVFTFTPKELRESTDVFGRGFRMAGIEPDDVVANLFMPGYLWSSFIVTNQALETIGCTILPIGVTTEKEKVAQLLLDLHATCLVGIPTQLMNVARAFEEMGINPGIKKVGYAGEHLSQGSRDYLRRVLGTEKIFSVGYAAVDVGPIAYACDQAQGTVHHVISDYCFVEILDPQTRQPVEEGEVGEIVVTNFSRRLTPTIRYAVGDLGRLLGGPCPCGRTAMRFELLGRSDDVLVVSGTNYSTSDVETLIEGDPRFTQNYQMVATNPRHRDTLTYRLELTRTIPRTEKENLMEEMARKARENKNLSYDLQAGLLDFQVELVEPGSLPSITRTQKTKRTLDHRS